MLKACSAYCLFLFLHITWTIYWCWGNYTSSKSWACFPLAKLRPLTAQMSGDLGTCLEYCFWSQEPKQWRKARTERPFLTAPVLHFIWRRVLFREQLPCVTAVGCSLDWLLPWSFDCGSDLTAPLLSVLWACSSKCLSFQQFCEPFKIFSKHFSPVNTCIDIFCCFLQIRSQLQGVPTLRTGPVSAIAAVFSTMSDSSCATLFN